MDKKIAAGMLTAVVLAGAGCATAGAKAKEADSLSARVDALESQVTAISQRVDESALNAPPADSGSARSSAAGRAKTAAKTRLTTRQAQKALTAAGYYKGNVDGKEGPQTQKAVKEFQLASGLKADGVIGRATSEALSRYLQE